MSNDSPFGAAALGRRGWLMVTGGVLLTAVLIFTLVKRAPAPSASGGDSAGGGQRGGRDG